MNTTRPIVGGYAISTFIKEERLFLFINEDATYGWTYNFSLANRFTFAEVAEIFIDILGVKLTHPYCHAVHLENL